MWRCGDGVRAIVVHTCQATGRTLKKEIVHNREMEFNLEAITVQPGDTLDFVVNFHANLNNDQFLWSPEIKMQENRGRQSAISAGNSPLPQPMAAVGSSSPAEQRARVCGLIMDYSRRQMLIALRHGAGALGLTSLLEDGVAHGAENSEATLAVTSAAFSTKSQTCDPLFSQWPVHRTSIRSIPSQRSTSTGPTRA